ncbi:uncharacterized protein C8Q71DRAFT_721410 [Rhodofomes roseus]|uniref:Uncharacterized protein n=1 Tax=Rhodofomes roseus TaxID=34475 RepID=A0ABQ8KR25_9APHY|nr:uncharacterized protein C8Q71DRAFT_721410 [Rhodofomes roseus]KAH9840980.1 hypothetical protein C8Q71DRAFT_721410 [Rhodofomes roseus]
MAREGKNVDRSAPDSEQRFSLDQLQQLLEALRLVSEQEAERQMWRDVDDPSHPMTSDLPASGSGGNPPGAGTVTQGGPSSHAPGAGALAPGGPSGHTPGAGTVAQGGHSGRAPGTVAQGGHSGCAGPADFAPPVRPPSPAPRVPSGPQGTSRVPAAPVIGNGSGNTGVGLCGGCCGNCGGYDRYAEDVGPGSSTGKLRWYSITKGKAIGVFCDWAIVGPLVLNVPDSSLDLPDPSLGLYTWPYKLVVPACYSTPFSEYDELFSDTDYVLDELKQALNMQQFLLLEDKGREHYALFNSSTKSEGEALLRRLDEELVQRLQSWEDTESSDMSTQAGVVQDVGTKWAARIICCLALELQLAKSGRNWGQWDYCFKSDARE